MLGDPCRPQAQGDRCDRYSVRPLHPAWHSRSYPVRQRTGVRGQGRAGMDRSCWRQDRLDRAGQSLGEWLHRELERAPSRRALDCEIFYSLREARIVIESWRRHYNTIRPHASIGYKPPAPEVFVPAFAAWPAALSQAAPPATLAKRPTLN